MRCVDGVAVQRTTDKRPRQNECWLSGRTPGFTLRVLANSRRLSGVSPVRVQRKLGCHISGKTTTCLKKGGCNPNCDFLFRLMNEEVGWRRCRHGYVDRRPGHEMWVFGSVDGDGVTTGARITWREKGAPGFHVFFVSWRGFV